MVDPTGIATLIANEADIEEIPGIGPIRCRSIKKAGHKTAGDLRRLSVDQLAAIRGLTAIKAKQLFIYLSRGGESVTSISISSPEHQTNDTPKLHTKTVSKAPKPRVTIPRKQISNPSKPETESVAIDCLTETLQPYDIMLELAHRAHLLLRSPQSTAMESNLARQVARIAGLPDTWDRETRLGNKRRERAVQYLVQLSDFLPYPAALSEMSRKMQNRVAEKIRRHRRMLLNAVD